MPISGLGPSALRRDALLRLGAFVFLALVLLGSLAVSFTVTPEELESGRLWLSPGCSFKRLTGHPCLGCGLTRGFAAFSHGRIGDGLGYNLLTPIFYVGFVVGGVASALAARRALGDFISSRQLRDPTR